LKTFSYCMYILYMEIYVDSVTLIFATNIIFCSYKAYKSRKYLAAIDWNYHLHISVASNKCGQGILFRRYNQRTQPWDVRKVKVSKGYQYIPLLTARMLRERIEDNESVTRVVPLNESDPQNIAPTIAAKAPPPPLKGTVEANEQIFKSSKERRI